MCACPWAINACGLSTLCVLKEIKYVLVFMSENIGKLTTPDVNGACIIVDKDTFYIEGNNSRIYNQRNTNYDEVVIAYKYEDNTTGAILSLRGPNDKDIPNNFLLCTGKDENKNTNTLHGKMNGTLTWCSKTIDTIYAFGNNYIQYTNGLLIQWGYINTINSNSNTIITLPIEYLSENSYNIQLTRRSGDSTTTIYNLWVRAPYTSNTFNIYGDASTGCFWTTIGRWK